jgi:hypothetical protein
MSSEEYGHSVSSMWGDNYGYLEFNSSKMNESEQIKLTAAHEFFHLVQSFYDGRNRFSKAKFAPDHLWIDEATAVWAEGLFSGDANYSSEIREGQIMAPFRGMQSGPNTDAQGYGYGMSALIKYFNQNKIVPIYNKIKTGSHPIEAVTSAHPNSALVWWPDFIKEYVRGNIYNDVSPLTLATDLQTQVFEIASDSDSLKEFQNSCPALSGIIYNIKLQNSNFDETSQLDFSLTEDSDLTLLVYKYKGSQIEYIDQTYNNLTVGDLKSLHDNNYYLLAVVANSDWSYPYTNMKNVDLTVRVKSDETINFSVFNYCELEFNNIEITRQSTDGSYWNGTGYFDIPPKSMVPDYTQGSFSGNVFTETWNKNQTNPNETWSGSLQISVDKESLTATSIAGNVVIEGSGYTITMNISASNVPLTYRVVPSNGKKQLFFNLKGTNVSSYITNLEWTTETDSGSEQIINMTYNQNTELDILFYE